jgi:hypothetical protein
LMKRQVVSLHFRTTLAARPNFGSSGRSAHGIHGPLASRHGGQKPAMTFGLGPRHRSTVKLQDARPAHVRARVLVACVCGGHGDHARLQARQTLRSRSRSLGTTYRHPTVAVHAVAAQRAAAAGSEARMVQDTCWTVCWECCRYLPCAEVVDGRSVDDESLKLAVI